MDRIAGGWHAARAPGAGAGVLRERASPGERGAGERATAAAPGPGAAVADAAIDAAMDRYAEGDEQAFALVHSGLQARLRLFLRRLCRDPAVADDLLQEVFLRIHRARGSFVRGSRALPWAYAIARNVHIDFARSARARHVQSLDDDDDSRPIEPRAGPGSDAEEVTMARQAAKTVEATLAALPVAQREAFVLLRYEGMSVQDAARILGVTENAVKMRAFHAYEALRAALGIEKEKANGGRSP